MLLSTPSGCQKFSVRHCHLPPPPLSPSLLPSPRASTTAELPPQASSAPELPATLLPAGAHRRPNPGTSPSCCLAPPSASHPGVRAGPAPDPGAHAASVSNPGAHADPASNPDARAALSCCCLPEPPPASSDCSSLCRL
jgi:hypothetical protein